MSAHQLKLQYHPYPILDMVQSISGHGHGTSKNSSISAFIVVLSADERDCVLWTTYVAYEEPRLRIERVFRVPSSLSQTKPIVCPPQRNVKSARPLPIFGGWKGAMASI